MNVIIAQLFFDSVQRIRGWHHGRALERLESTQWQPVELVAEARLIALKQLLHHCYSYIPYYRSRWKQIGFHPEDLRSEHDLAKLPVISKEDLRAGYDQFLCEKGPKYDVFKSSGSTGSPFAFRIDKRSIAANTFAALARGQRWWGFEYGQPMGMIWSGVTDVGGTISGRIAARKRRVSWKLKNIALVDVYNLDENTIRKGYNSFLRIRPKMLRTISSGLYRFCVGLEHLGLDGTRLGIKGAIYTGEALPETQRRFVERVLECKTICEYGCTELGIIGFECPEGKIHVSHDNLVLEYIIDGKPAKRGEAAELIVTNLYDFASPLVRYRVGDIIVPSDSDCSCGRTLPVIERIGGRTHDAVVAKDGSIVHGLFFTHIFDEYEDVHQFRIVQENIDMIRIELISSSKLELSIINGIRNIVSKRMGAGVTVDVIQVDKLPVSPSGKTRWIISKVSEEGLSRTV